MDDELTGLEGLGGGALGIGPQENDTLGQLGVPGYPGPSAQGGGSDAIDDLILGRRVVDPLAALYGLRAARRQNTGPTAQGVPFVNLHKPSVFDQLAELALVVGAIKARSAARKRQAQKAKASNTGGPNPGRGSI